MIDVSEKVFNTLKEKLISERPKSTPYGKGGIGFDNTNVTEYISSSTTPKTPYDFVEFAVGGNTQVGSTIDSAREKQQRVSYIINIYCKNITTSAVDRKSTQKRSREILALISDTMNDMGFIRSGGFLEDSNHQETGIYRIAVTFTRQIGNGDILNK